MSHRRMLAGVAAGALTALSAAAVELSANEVMQRNFYATKISSFKGEATMTLINDRNQERMRKINVASRLKDNGVDAEVIIRFTQPADIKDTAFLQIENSKANDDIWVYLAALGKSRRLVSNNKKDSFFGTDFSYGDVLLPPVDRYKHTLVGEESIDGNDCYIVDSVPASDKVRTDNGYARKRSWIDKKDFLERKVVYYDVNDKLLKTQTTADHKLLEPGKQRWIPMRREMQNHQTGHKTVYQFERLDLVPSLSGELFSTRALERR